MRKALTFITLLLLAISMVEGTTPNKPLPNEEPDRRIRLKERDKGNINRAPSNNYIDCHYHDGLLEFSTTLYYSSMSVTVTHEDTGEETYHYITSSYPVIDMPGESGLYTITCVTDENRTFSGQLEI